MIKVHSRSALLSILFLTGCYIGVSDTGYKYIGIDWNSDQLDKRLSYKQAVSCSDTQEQIAKQKLQDKYNIDIAGDIYTKCINNKSYKFEFDPKYASY